MEPKRGLFAGGGTTVRLPRQLAFPAAMEFLLTAEAFPAARALELGLLNEIVPEDELTDRALDWARRITRERPAGRAGHQGERAAGPGRRPARGLTHRGRAGGRVFSSEDAKEGPKAFAEKRRPPGGGGDARPPHAVPRRRGPADRPPGRGGARAAGALGGGGPGGGRRRLPGHGPGAGGGRQPPGRVLHGLALRRSGRPARRGPRDRARHRLYSGIGGTTPQVLVQDAAAAILAGGATWP